LLGTLLVSLRLPSQGNKAGEDYTGGRTAADIVTFFNTKTGAERVLGGGVTAAAGRVPALDEIAKKFLATQDAAERKALYEELQSAADAHPNHKQFAPFYKTVVKNLLDGKADYPQKELDRLKKVTGSSHLTPQSLATMHKRMNIMKQFIAGEAGHEEL
jgi:protein disulfide-isomerase A6